MRKLTLAFALLILPSLTLADRWIIYTDKGWKGVIYVNDGSGSIRSGSVFSNRQGSSCPVLSGQSFSRNVRSSNISGAIGTTCGVWNVWKAQYAIPAIQGTTGNYSSPFGRIFNGKVILE